MHTLQSLQNLQTSYRPLALVTQRSKQWISYVLHFRLAELLYVLHILCSSL